MLIKMLRINKHTVFTVFIVPSFRPHAEFPDITAGGAPINKCEEPADSSFFIRAKKNGIFEYFLN